MFYKLFKLFISILFIPNIQHQNPIIKHTIISDEEKNFWIIF
jgi:hypothetical protein